MSILNLYTAKRRYPDKLHRADLLVTLAIVSLCKFTSYFCLSQSKITVTIVHNNYYYYVSK